MNVEGRQRSKTEREPHRIGTQLFVGLCELQQYGSHYYFRC